MTIKMIDYRNWVSYP